ncbi:MAG: glycosyltransferase [Armatimonadota bacterium]|nr:glycosyltransferase [Armatimonadota bacterium]
MKIAIFTESYHPVVNGVTRSVDTLVEGLSADGHIAHVFAPGAPAPGGEEPFVHRFPTYFLPIAPDYPLAIPFSRPIFEFFVRQQFDLIHIQTPFALGLCGLYLARRFKIPVVATLHTLYVEYSHYVPILPDRLVRYLLQAGIRAFYNRVDAVVAPSPSVACLLRQYGVVSPLRVVPTGVEMPQPLPKAAARECFGLPAEVPVLLYVGRLAREKNIELLLKAFKIILNSLPHAHLLVVGSGPADAEMKSLACALGIQQRVIFAGFRPHAEVTAAISAADLFLFPSSTDTQAVSVVEAMALSVPPVVINAFGPADFVVDGVSGRVVPSNAGEMAHAAIEILCNPLEWQRLSTGAKCRAEEFSTAATLQLMINLYEDVLARSPGASAADQP